MSKKQHYKQGFPFFSPLLVLLLWNGFYGCSSLNMENAALHDKSYQGFGKSGITPEILSTYAPPPLDVTQKGRIEKMLDIRSPSLGLISPDGDHLFINWDVTGTNQVWKISSSLPFPIQMTGGEDPTDMVALTPDGQYLLLSRDHHGQEFAGLYLQKTTGGELVSIVHKENVQVSYQMCSRDSQYIYFKANIDALNFFALYRYHIPTGTIEKVFAQSGQWSLADIKEDGTLLLAKWLTNFSQEFYEWVPLLNSATSPTTTTSTTSPVSLITPASSTSPTPSSPLALTPLIGIGENEDYNVKYGPKNTLIVLTNKFSDTRRLYLYQRDSRQFIPITNDIHDEIHNFHIDSLKEKVFLTMNRKGYLQGEVRELPSGKKIPFPTFPKGQHIYFGTTSANARWTTLGLESARSPRINYIWDWNLKHLKQWVLPSLPEMELGKFQEDSLEYYPAADGTKIPMFVRRPPGCIPGKKVCPVVVNYHGGPEGQSWPGLSPSVQMFVDQGFIYVQPNVRGSSGQGKKWLNSDNGPKRLKVISDIADCALYIKKHWSAHGEHPKIGIMGGSYGGYLTLFGMTKYAGLYDAGVARVGMSNLLSFLKNTASFRRDLRKSEYGDPIIDEKALKELSPLSYLHQIKGPILVIHGVHDQRVPVGEALQFIERVKKKNKTAELIIFPNEGHGLRHKENRVLALGHTINFFLKHLKSDKEKKEEAKVSSTK